MNYYERHIGDYIRDTVSLTMLEDGAYSRLLDQYYQSERPLPGDKKEIYRLARANSAAERKAVDYVLQRYFEQTAEGYRQKRCDEVIEEFWERDQGRESKRENDRERQRRARERRAQLFDQLRAHGIVPAFNTPTRELQAQLSRVTDRDESQNVTRDDTATQTPLPTSQHITTANAVVVDSDHAADLVGSRRAKPECPHQAIIALYHELLPMSPGIRDWTPARAQALRARWNEDAKRQNLDYWRKFFAYVAESEFLTGRARTTDGRRPFVASLDWIIKAENFTKIREGRYHNEQVAA